MHACEGHESRLFVWAVLSVLNLDDLFSEALALLFLFGLLFLGLVLQGIREVVGNGLSGPREVPEPRAFLTLVFLLLVVKDRQGKLEVDGEDTKDEDGQ